MRHVRRRSMALLAIMVLGVALGSSVSFGSDCGPVSSCPMVQAGSQSHCQPKSAITSDCCADMVPVASQSAPARVPVEPTEQVAPLVVGASAGGTVVPVADWPEPLASKLHDIGRHTLFQVFLS